MQRHKLAIMAFLAVICLVIPAVSHAQWSESDYSVDTVLASIGNYSYSAGSSGGDVDAVTPTSPAQSSTIKVKFVRYYDAAPGTPPLTITPYGHLTGSQSGGGGTATSRVSDTRGQVQSMDTTIQNPYDVTKNLTSYSVSLLRPPPISSPRRSWVCPTPGAHGPTPMCTSIRNTAAMGPRRNTADKHGACSLRVLRAGRPRPITGGS